MSANMRVAHLRLKNGRPLTRTNHDDLSDYDRIVTVCWQIDREEGDDTIIRYGATVYKKRDYSSNSPTEPQQEKQEEDKQKKNVDWVKKLHYEKAVERFNREPVILAINDPMNFPNPLIDWFIAKNLIYKFGCKLSEKNTMDIVISIPSREDFKLLYDPVNYVTDDCSYSSTSYGENENSCDRKEKQKQQEKQERKEVFDMADEFQALTEAQNYSSNYIGLKFWALYGVCVCVSLAFYFSIV